MQVTNLICEKSLDFNMAQHVTQNTTDLKLVSLS